MFGTISENIQYHEPAKPQARNTRHVTSQHEQESGQDSIRHLLHPSPTTIKANDIEENQGVMRLTVCERRRYRVEKAQASVAEMQPQAV